MRLTTAILLTLFACSVCAQTRMRDVWATAPDEVAPLLTGNNRLDMIDFAENNMEAQVRNRLDGFSRLDTLTDDYLHVTLTSKTELEMKLLAAGTDTLIAVVHTSSTPSKVSSMTFFNLDWSEAGIHFDLPSAGAFVEADSLTDCSAAERVQCARSELGDLPLIHIQLSADDSTLRLDIAPVALSAESRRAVKDKLHPIIYIWNEETRNFTAPRAGLY